MKQHPSKRLNLRLRFFTFRQRLGSFFPLLAGLTGIVLLFFGSVVAYMVIEDWDFFDSLYMVVITLATVGFGEVRPLSHNGRILTMVLILTGVGLFTFIAGSVAQVLVEGRIQNLLGRRRMRKVISKMSDHCIVCGFGKIGSVVAAEIHGENSNVVVVENNPAMIEAIEKAGILYVQGDATEDETLLAAGLKQAKSLVATLSVEAANVYVVLTARALNPNLTIVARADTEIHINRLKLAGADRVVLTHRIGGLRMAQSILRPTVTTFQDLVQRGDLDLQMEELIVTPSSELCGKDLVQTKIRQRFNLIIVTMKKTTGQMLYNPHAQTVIEPGDTLVAIGSKESLNKMMEIL
jgi:voltage-gated potassium channel